MRSIIPALVLSAMIGQPALSVGDETPAAPAPTETTTQCTQGLVWDEKLKTCVEIKESRLSGDQLFETAQELAYAGRYSDAIALLKRGKNSNSPRILNMLGYSYRQLGETDLAFDYYKRALIIDPDFHLARSYMGQGLASLGRRKEAVLQLGEIRRRGGGDTHAYAMLKQTLEGGYNY